MGLDKPIFQQYWIYLSELLRGNFGRSVITRESVWVEFTHAFPATIELSIMATLLALIIGLPAGILAGTRRGSVADYSVMMVAEAEKTSRSGDVAVTVMSTQAPPAVMDTRTQETSAGTFEIGDPLLVIPAPGK